MEEKTICQEKGLIYKKISAVMKDVGAVAKNDVNKTQGFMYRGIDSVMNAINPAFQKHGVFIVPEVLSRDQEVRTTAKGYVMYVVICRIEYRFYAEDGSYIKAVVIGEAMDNADKATNKAMAIAFKYACFQVLCIPTEEMSDSDTSGEPVAPRNDEKKESGKKADCTKKKNDNKEPEINPGKAAAELIDTAKKNVIKGEIVRTGVDEAVILNLFKIKTVDEMTNEQFQKVMKKFTATPNKES